MLIRTGRSSIVARRANYLIFLWIFILCVEISAIKTHQNNDFSSNRTSSSERGRFTQKKPRSAQYGFMPRIQAVYPRQSVPVRLTTIPVNGGYRLPITGAQRLTNVAPLARMPSLQRAYVPIIGSIPSMRYPLIHQNGLANRYVVPYTLKMPASRLTATPQAAEDFGKHYNEKYNTLPSISNMDLEQDGFNMRGKTESKKLDIGDEFDNFLESLDGPCSKNPCKNGAKCHISRGGTSFHCICKRGYMGKTCEDKNACFPNPCENEGECTLTNEGFECSCSKRFKGKKCEQENTCEPNPCENDGVCTELKSGGFECTCKKGHFGDKCQVSKRGCNPNPCHNNGRCTERDNGRYECICAEGYAGTKCDRPDNKCFMNPCKNGGSCMQAMTSLGYECACARGFRGTNCEDHSGCDITSCQNGGTCYETEFGVRCICKNGYSGDKCQIRKFCEADTCQNNGKCIEHVSGFRCVCPEGYRGKMCDEIDSCRPNPCQHGGHCEQSDSRYFCKCTSQYQGRNCEVSNPCSRNPCKNGGKCLSGLDGQQYQCQCLDGYLGTTCEERNACQPNPCENNGVCRRNGVGFTCECRDNFEGKTCREKDPCRNNPCQNNGVCSRNGNNAFTCSCPKDYKGIRCEVKRHCQPNPCMNDGVCEESDNAFICSCKEGFRGHRCEEQDQCAPNPCKNGGRCVSIGIQGNRKAFVCECANSFFGDTCEERNPCHPNPCANNGQCAEINGGFTCQCSAGYKGDRCHEIDKCNPNPCQHQGSCTEVIGGMGYACKCAYGYKGQDCEQKDYCHPNPCDHDGQCMLLNNEAGFQCKCAPGFMGQRCSESNPCEPNPCLHDSHCVLLPGFGKNHECNCSIGWSGDTCQKREICQPNPCQFGTKCVETGDDSYSCVKSMCHPNPCQNDGKCINVNQDNFQCACTDNFEGNTCDGDDLPTNKDKSNRASIERHTTANSEPATTNIDNLLQLVDNTLNAYKSKHGHTKTHKNTKKVTNLLRKLKNADLSDKETRKLTPQRLDEADTPSDDDLMTYYERPNDITKHAIINKNTNENTQNTNDNSDIMKLDEELIKSINPQGEVVVESSRRPPPFSEPPTTDSPGVDRDDIQNNLMNNLQTNLNQTELEDNILDDINDEEAFVKSINPAGGVVVSDTDPDSEVPRRQSQLSLVPSSPPSIYSQLSPILPAKTPPSLQLVKSTPRVSAPDVKSEKPPIVSMSAIASCSPFLCQNGGVCVQEEGKSIRCKCPPKYTGETCEGNKCQVNPCQNNGTCISVEREPGFVCKCRDGLTGPLCSRKPCEPNPCKNDGQCVMFYSIYLCKCKSGFQGKLCEDNLGLSYIGNETPTNGINKLVNNNNNNNNNNEQGRTNNINFIAKKDYKEYSSEPKLKDTNNNNLLPTTSQDNSKLLYQTTTAKPDEQTYVLIPDKNVLRTDGNKLLSTSSEISELNSNIGLPNADFGAQANQFTPNDKDLGAIDTSGNINAPLESKTGSVVGTETGRVVATETEKEKEPKPALIIKASQAVSPCSPSPCKNAAQCVESSDGEYECICPQDFSGPICEDEGLYKYSSAPKFFPGENEECKHCDRNARCVNGHCVCKNKFVGDGLECWERTQNDIDWTCSNNPCKNGGTCKKGRSGCVCRMGFVGDYCQEFSPPVVHLTFDKLSAGNRVMDMSGYGNDAIINRGFQIAPKEGKCDNAGNLLGGDILFDGAHFRGIPRRAITIAVWVKLTTALGIQSIFDTIGSHSRHKDGQYHFEIDNGRVRWFHRNEDGKTVFSVVTDQIVVREGNWTLITGTYSADKNRARIYVNGDMMKEASGHKMALSEDWGLKAGIATLPELDVPYADELDDDTSTENDYYKNNFITDRASLKDKQKLGFLLLKTVKNSQDNNQNGDVNNNREYIEKILNKDKETLSDNDDGNVYTFIRNNRLGVLKNNKDYTINDINNIDMNRNDENYDRSDDNLMILNNKRLRRDGKHEHPYGARVLRGMVDEFSIFPSELSRLQILVLLTHCKVYYNRYSKKTSTAPAEISTETKPYAPAIQAFAQPAGSYVPQSYQTQASYYQAPNAPAKPLPSNNVPPTYNYQSGSNPMSGGQNYYSGSYYGNTAKPGYQQETIREQAGYQRSQGAKRPAVQPNIAGYRRPTKGPTVTPYEPSSPTSVSSQSTYVSGTPSYATQPPSFVPKLPKYVPKPPSYTKGSSRAGIPTRAYQRTYAQTSTMMYPYNRQPNRVRQNNWGYPKSYTPQSPPTGPYNTQWSGTKQDQIGYGRSQTPPSPVNYRRPSYNVQYQQNTGNYNGYAARRNQQPSSYYSQGGIFTGTGATPTGITSQGAGYPRNRVQSPGASNIAYNTMPYQAAQTNTASQGYRYSNIPQTTSTTQYNTAQYMGNIPGGQYQSIVPAGGRQSGQYGPQVNALNSEYPPWVKSSIPQNSYRPRNQNSFWGNDVTGQITSPGDVTRTSYPSVLQSTTQNAYPRNNLNNNPSPYTNPVSQQYTSPYAAPSIQPEYGPSYAYPVGSGIDHGAVRANIPRPKYWRVNQNSRTVHVANQNRAQSQKLKQNARTIQGQSKGPLQNKNKPSRIYKLDEYGQYPADIKTYNIAAKKRPAQALYATSGAGITPPSYMGLKQPPYTRNRNSWSTRTRTPTGRSQWTSGGVARMGSYDRWSTGMQTQKPGRLWNSGPVAKVDEAVKYNNDVTTQTMPQTTATATDAGNRPATKDIDMDNVVQKALTDFLTTHVVRKRKRRKREDKTHEQSTTNRQK